MARPAVGPFGVAMIIASVAFLAAGIIWPQAAEVWFRLLLVTLAVGYLLGRAYDALQPVSTRPDFSSPFHGPAVTRNRPAAPAALRELGRELSAADDARRARRIEIPRSVRWTVIDEATRRLAEHHGLSPREPSHHEPIRSVVSEATWSLIRPLGPGARGSAASRHVPLSQLGHILEDLERL